MRLVSWLGLALAMNLPMAAAEILNYQGPLKGGEHKGERRGLEANIEFSGQSGTTMTNQAGIFYRFYNTVLSEPKVYLQKYWGVFPLYFFGQKVGAQVSLTNLGPRNTIKVRITTQVFSMNTDGSNGAKLAPDVVKEFWVDKGQTFKYDASFTPQFVAGADSGLDRVVILIQHPNEGGQAENNSQGNGLLQAADYPALIMAKEAIICPPDYQSKAK